MLSASNFFLTSLRVEQKVMDGGFPFFKFCVLANRFLVWRLVEGRGGEGLYRIWEVTFERMDVMKKGFVMNILRWVVRHDWPLPFAVCVCRCDNVKPCSSNHCCQHGVTCMYETSRPPFSVLSQIFCLRYSSHSCTTLISKCIYSLVTSIHALHLFIRYIHSCVEKQFPLRSANFQIENYPSTNLKCFCKMMNRTWTFHSLPSQWQQ